MGRRGGLTRMLQRWERLVKKKMIVKIMTNTKTEEEEEEDEEAKK